MKRFLMAAVLSGVLAVLAGSCTNASNPTVRDPLTGGTWSSSQTNAVTPNAGTQATQNLNPSLNTPLVGSGQIRK